MCPPLLNTCLPFRRSNDPVLPTLLRTIIKYYCKCVSRAPQANLFSWANREQFSAFFLLWKKSECACEHSSKQQPVFDFSDLDSRRRRRRFSAGCCHASAVVKSETLWMSPQALRAIFLYQISASFFQTRSIRFVVLTPKNRSWTQANILKYVFAHTWAALTLTSTRAPWSWRAANHCFVHIFLVLFEPFAWHSFMQMAHTHSHGTWRLFFVYLRTDALVGDRLVKKSSFAYKFAFWMEIG